MAVQTKQRRFVRLGVNSDATARTGSPSSWKYVPVQLGGLKMAGAVAAEDVELERKDPGVTHVLPTTRNAGKGSIDCPLYPELAGTLLNMAMTDSALGIPQFHTIEQYYTLSPGPGFDAGDSTGMKLAGVLADGFSFGFDRKQLGLLTLSLPAFLNADYDLESAAPTPTWPTSDPVVGKNCLADIDFADNSNAYAGWGGDQTDLRSLQIAFARNLELDLHRADEATVELDGAWTQAYPGTPTCQLSFKLIHNSGKHRDLFRLAAGLRKCRVRLAWRGSSPTGSTTCTTSLTAGSSVTVAVAATTGFAVNDYVLLRQVTANKFAVGKVTTVNSGVSLVIDTLDVSMDGTSETIRVQNQAGQVKVSDARIKSAGSEALDGNVYTIDVTADAVVGPSSTAPVAVSAYDDDNT